MAAPTPSSPALSYACIILGCVTGYIRGTTSRSLSWTGNMIRLLNNKSEGGSAVSGVLLKYLFHDSASNSWQINHFVWCTTSILKSHCRQMWGLNMATVLRGDLLRKSRKPVKRTPNGQTQTHGEGGRRGTVLDFIWVLHNLRSDRPVRKIVDFISGIFVPRSHALYTVHNDTLVSARLRIQSCKGSTRNFTSVRVSEHYKNTYNFTICNFVYICVEPTFS